MQNSSFLAQIILWMGWVVLSGEAVLVTPGKTSFFELTKESSVLEADTRFLVCSWMSTSLLDIHTNRSCSNSTVCVFTFIAIDALSVMSCQLIIQIQIVKPPNTNCKRSWSWTDIGIISCGMIKSGMISCGRIS